MSISKRYKRGNDYDLRKMTVREKSEKWNVIK